MNILRCLFNATSYPSLYSGAAKTLLEARFGEVMLHFPVEGGPVEAFFKHPVFIADALRSDENGCDLREVIGRGATKHIALTSLFEAFARHERWQEIMAYRGEVVDRPGLYEYRVFRFQSGDFVSDSSRFVKAAPQRRAGHDLGPVPARVV